MADDPSTAASRFIEAFNRFDVGEMVACFATPSFILDGMQPHVWSGPAAPADWRRDVLAEAEHLGFSDFQATLGPPLHDAVTGDAAYFAAPATMTFNARGLRVTQSGAVLTTALRRLEGRWLISAWCWTKGVGGGVDDVARTT